MEVVLVEEMMPFQEGLEISGDLLSPGRTLWSGAVYEYHIVSWPNARQLAAKSFAGDAFGIVAINSFWENFGRGDAIEFGFESVIGLADEEYVSQSVSMTARKKR
jgi:hypothetical protein